MSVELWSDVLQLEHDFNSNYYATGYLTLSSYRVAKVYQNGKVREIHEPEPKLAGFQRRLSKLIYRVFRMHPALHSVAGRSIVTNSDQHIGSKHLLKMDISKYYGTIRPEHIRVYSTEYDPAYCNIQDVDMLFLSQVEYFVNELVKRIAFVEIEDHLMLPTGSPSSPAIGNLVGWMIDCQATDLAQQHGYIYTRYMDDLTFSSVLEMNHRLVAGTTLESRISYEVFQQGFNINKAKTEWCYAKDTSKRYFVTGINLPRDTVVHRIPYAMRRLIRARINRVRIKGGVIDQVTQGYLAYVHGIEPELYDSYMEQLNGTSDNVSTGIES